MTSQEVTSQDKENEITKGDVARMTLRKRGVHLADAAPLYINYHGLFTALANPTAPPINDLRTPNNGRMSRMPPRFAWKNPLALLFLCFQVHKNFRFSLHSCPNDCDCGSLFESQITRDNAFPCFFGEYIVSHVSFSEIVAVRIRYVVIATRSNELTPLANRFSNRVLGLRN
ncbi:hypothetical protein G5I_07439 [Acromyrmex echinatior]|uniref:Uncharacterized protein n=1 Tax=Acromyrmex echinatior TaxID=103372 RepID=F4WNT4_ACREC|nr:hypothetical protein G5I_07439 [Acromyrmex echinatior]